MSSETNECSKILRDFKRVTSKKLLKAIADNPQESRKEWMLWMFERAGQKNANNTQYQFWQQDNHPIEISANTEDLEKSLSYIHDNPVKAGFVEQAEQYPYSSAMDYASKRGLVKIELIYG